MPIREKKMAIEQGKRQNMQETQTQHNASHLLGNKNGGTARKIYMKNYGYAPSWKNVSVQWLHIKNSILDVPNVKGVIIHSAGSN